MSPILSRLSSPYGFAFYAGASGPTPPSGLGAVYGGGFYIGILSGAWWIVSDSDTEIGGGFNNRNTAINNAEAEAACGDWFIPTYTELGWTKGTKSYWDSYSSHPYWSATVKPGDNHHVGAINFQPNSGNNWCWCNNPACMRAFRKVVY